MADKNNHFELTTSKYTKLTGYVCTIDGEPVGQGAVGAGPGGGTSILLF